MPGSETPEALLVGERVTFTKRVSAILHPSAFGLGAAFSTMGPDAEAIGGRLSLTQWRVIFESHSLNRVVGTFSLILPDVVEARDVSRGVRRVVMLTLADGAEHRFVMWGASRRFWGP